MALLLRGNRFMIFLLRYCVTKSKREAVYLRIQHTGIVPLSICFAGVDAYSLSF